MRVGVDGGRWVGWLGGGGLKRLAFGVGLASIEPLEAKEGFSDTPPHASNKRIHMYGSMEYKYMEN